MINPQINNEPLKQLEKISQTVVSEQYLDNILDVIVSVTAEMLNSKICSIMLYDSRKKILSIKATQSLSDKYISKPDIKIGESISGKAVTEKKPITVKDVTKEPRYKYPEIAKQEGLVSMLAVPMMVRNKVIGVVNVYSSVEHDFSESEIKVLQLIANLAAVAIDNKNLLEEVLRVRETLETRKVVEKAKGLLMRHYGISEDEAYKRIHKKSMDTRKPMKDIAESIIIALGDNFLSKETKGGK